MEKFLHEADSAQQAEASLFELKQINESDSIALILEYKDQRLTEAEIKAHEVIWKLKSVRATALSTRNRLSELGYKLKAVTETDKYQDKKSKFFVVGLYALDSSTGMALIATFRVVDGSLVEEYDVQQDRWKKYVDIEGEFFEAFFDKFKMDSLFQRERVEFPFLVESIDTDSDTGPDKFNKKYIQKEDWKYANFHYDESFATRGVDAYTQTIRIQLHNAVVQLRGVDNGIWIDYLFEKKVDKWMLVSEHDSSN
jgi:hypothetical protein